MTQNTASMSNITSNDSQRLYAETAETSSWLFMSFFRNPKLTAYELKEVFDYDPNTGCLTWKVQNSNRVSVGDRAGWVYERRGRKSRMVRLNGLNLQEHRVIWAWFYGKWPDHIIDHRDNNAENNRIKNLRECSHSQNTMNSKLRSDNASGYKGVSWCKMANKYVANINIGGVRSRLGYFESAEEAGKAYASAAINLHGEFARLQ